MSALPARAGAMCAPPARARDIESRADVHDAVVAFYREVVFDDHLAPVFGEVAEVDWSVHIPKLIDYWCRVLFGDPGYSGAILAAHRDVHDLEPFDLDLFDRWYALWSATIDRGWRGPVADAAKEHAARIGAVLARKLVGRSWQRPPSASGTTSAGHLIRF